MNGSGFTMLLPGDDDETHAEPAPRLPDLNGKRLGLLDNHRTSADVLLRDLQEFLSERFRIVSAVQLQKPDDGDPAPDALLDELAAQSDVVINAIGA